MKKKRGFLNSLVKLLIVPVLVGLSSAKFVLLQQQRYEASQQRSADIVELRGLIALYAQIVMSQLESGINTEAHATLYGAQKNSFERESYFFWLARQQVVIDQAGQTRDKLISCIYRIVLHWHKDEILKTKIDKAIFLKTPLVPAVAKATSINDLEAWRQREISVASNLISEDISRPLGDLAAYLESVNAAEHFDLGFIKF